MGDIVISCDCELESKMYNYELLNNGRMKSSIRMPRFLSVSYIISNNCIIYLCQDIVFVTDRKYGKNE
jgi:hypothetical protein